MSPPSKKRKSRAALTKAQDKARLKAQDWAVEGKEYVLGRKIGSGAFATAYLATHAPTGKMVVIKRLDRAKQEQMKQVCAFVGC